MSGVLLDDDDLDAIAHRLVELLRPQPVPELVDVARVCAHFGVTRSWVYAHADDLGAVRLGNGPRARLRFDLQRASEYFVRARRDEATPEAVARTRPRRRAVKLPPGVPLIEGRSART